MFRLVLRHSKISTICWQDILPLTAKLNKMTSLLKDNNMGEDMNVGQWFT